MVSHDKMNETRTLILKIGRMFVRNVGTCLRGNECHSTEKRNLNNHQLKLSKIISVYKTLNTVFARSR
jgi:hypothetical protein